MEKNYHFLWREKEWHHLLRRVLNRSGGKLDLISTNGAESHQVGKDSLLGLQH